MKGLIGESVRPLSETREANITGCLLAIGLAPIFVRIEEQEYLAIFSTEGKLRQSMKFHNVDHYKIQKITNGKDFLECLWAQGVEVVLDPHPHEGNTRFQLLKPKTQQGTA